MPPKIPEPPKPTAVPKTFVGVASSSAASKLNKPPPKDNNSPPVNCVASFNAEPAVPKPSLIGLLKKSVTPLLNLSNKLLGSSTIWTLVLVKFPSASTDMPPTSFVQTRLLLPSKICVKYSPVASSKYEPKELAP